MSLLSKPIKQLKTLLTNNNKKSNFQGPLTIFLFNNENNRMLANFYILLKGYEVRRTQYYLRGQSLYISPEPPKNGVNTF